MTPIPFPAPMPQGPWPALGAVLLPRLALEPTRARTGVFDGAWWPRTARLRRELPDLVTAFAAHFGRVVRVGLDTSVWDEVPRSLTVQGRAVRINFLCGSGGTISLSRGFQDNFLLLVVPPATDSGAAAHAMAGAARTGNHTSAAELLG